MSNEQAGAATLPVVTHAFIAKQGEKRGVERSVEVARFSDGNYGVSFKTVWGPGAEPTITTMRLTTEAMNLLAGALFEAQHNMDAHPVGDSEPGEP